MKATPIILTSIWLIPSIHAQYGGGTGEPNDPYLIHTAEHLNAIGTDPNDWSKHFKLMADIDLSGFNGTRFKISGNLGTPFTGVLDGNGHVVSNFSYTSIEAHYIGLLGYVSGSAEIKGLGLINPDINVDGGMYVGSLVGCLRNGTVTGCYVEGGIVSGERNVGGLVGAHGEEYVYPEPPFTISGCYSTSSVQGGIRVGGLVGSNYEGRITDCYATGSVSGQNRVGGLVGENGYRGTGFMRPRTPGTIMRCYSTGFVSGDLYVGGLVGLHTEGTVIACFWDMEASGQITSSGGTGKTTVAMKTADTFTGWGGCGNAGTWTIDDGVDYPRLSWENKPGMPLERQLSDFLQGTGTENDPYLIYSDRQLSMIGRFPCEWDKHFKLMADIELGEYTGTSFNLIGHDEYYPFTGVFDGNGRAISDFTYDSNGTNYLGLFRYVSGKAARIKTLGLIGSRVSAGTGSCVGLLVGCLVSGTVTGCHVDGGTVRGADAVGGLVGDNNGTISNCSATGSVSGFWDVGGLAGGNNYLSGWLDPGGAWGLSRIEDCYAACNVAGTGYVGGLVGGNERGGTIRNCYSAGQVEGESDLGGLVGWSEGSIISSFWDIQISSQGTSAGGQGKTTTEMQTVTTFLEAGWDFVDETENGTAYIWWILEGQDYPRLGWQYGLAFSAHPPNGAVGVAQPVTLDWFPGGLGLFHDVYFGEDEKAVADATTESPGIYRGRQLAETTTYDPGTLELDKTYYWRIDEVDVLDPKALRKGNIWSFTTANFVVIDDFESYTDEEGNHIWETWIDGLGCQRCEPSIPGNGTTSLVGHQWYGWLETPVHGGRQSMVLAYDNTALPCYGEIERTWGEPQNWKIPGVDTLELFFLSGTGAKDGDRLYIAIEDNDGQIALAAHPNADALATRNWQRWDIPLADLAGANVDVAVVKKMYIGVGDRNEPQPGGTGMICIDDIRVTKASPGEFDFIVVDDFESYNDIDPPDPVSHRIFDVWIDGFGIATNGALVGFCQNIGFWRRCHPQPIHGGSQSMDFYYDNSGAAYYSEATRTLTDLRDWTREGVGVLSLWFYGDPNNTPEPIYVGLANVNHPAAVIYHENPDAVLIDEWTEWEIELQEFAAQGVNLANVDTISIGFGDRNNTQSSGSGFVFLYDIRLYRPQPVASYGLEANAP